VIADLQQPAAAHLQHFGRFGSPWPEQQ
jgi:hypothetical protein